MEDNDKFRSDKTPLKPCPFCGGEVVIDPENATFDFHFECLGCEVIFFMPGHKASQGYANLFNRRVNEHYTKEEIEDEFGRYRHDMAHPEHSKKKGHFCDDFDGLWICSDCGEFACCRCFEKED